MKKCLQCDQVYGDDTNFCLSDGSTLVSVTGVSGAHGEAPTVFSGAPAPTSYNNQPFIVPNSPAAQPAPAKSNTVLIALAVGFLALLVGGAVVGLAMYGIFYSGNGEPNNAATNNSNSAAKSNQNADGQKSVNNDNLAWNLKQQQEKLDKDKQKLEDERKALEAKKKEASQTPPTPPTTSARTASIIDPPSNIRAAPNGAVLCVARTRGTIVNILGSTGVTDSNGTWYYTDYCGSRGVIHSSQFRF
jgi:hypothetical protein